MKFPYFKIKDAFNEARDSFSYGSGSEKLAATAKLLGKSVANVGMLATEIGVDAIKKAPEHFGSVAKRNLDERSHLMSDDQKEKAHQMVKAGEDAREKRLEKEREEENRKREEERKFDGM